MEHGIGYVISKRTGFDAHDARAKFLKLQFYYDVVYQSLQKSYQSILQLLLNFCHSWKTLQLSDHKILRFEYIKFKKQDSGHSLCRSI